MTHHSEVHATGPKPAPGMRRILSFRGGNTSLKHREKPFMRKRSFKIVSFGGLLCSSLKWLGFLFVVTPIFQGQRIPELMWRVWKRQPVVTIVSPGARFRRDI